MMRGCTALATALALLVLSVTDARAEFFHLWSHGYGDSLYDVVSGVAVDADGSIALTGFFDAAIDFGGGPLESAGILDIFVARLNADGTHRWSRRFGDGGVQFCRAIAMAPSGDVAITGYFGGTVDFGGGPLVAVNPPDLFIACFDRDGAHRWSRSFPRPLLQVGLDVAIDADGNAIVAGSFEGQMDLGGGLLYSTGKLDAFLAKYDRDGNHLWSKRFGDGNDQEGWHVAVDASGNVNLAGYFVGSIDLGGGALTSAGNLDVYVGQWDAAGSPRWSHAYGDAGNQTPTDLAVAAGGEIAIAGDFSGEIDFGGGTLVAGPSSNTGFLALLNGDGTHRWSTALPGTTSDLLVQSLSFAGTDVLAGGLVKGSVTLQGWDLSAFGDADALLLRFDPNGTLTDAMVRGRELAESVAAIAPAANGDIVLGGHYAGDTNLGGDGIPFAGTQDIFVAAYNPTDPNYTPIAAFSAIAHGGIVEVRWQLAIAQPSATYRLVRRADPDTLWTMLEEGTTDASSGAYDDASVAPGSGYSYRLIVDEDTGSYASTIASVQVPAAALALLQNAPNPFRGATSIVYSIGGQTPVVIGIYDASGRRVALLDQGVRQAGEYEVSWDGSNASGQPAASGVYFYRLEGIPAMGAKKMLLLK